MTAERSPTAGASPPANAGARREPMNPYRILLADLVRSLGWLFPVLILLMAAVGLTEGLSIALLLPLLSQLGVSAVGNQGATFAQVAKLVTAISPSTGPGTMLAVIIVLSMVQAGLFIWLSWWTFSLAKRYQSRQQARLFRAFIRAQWSFLSAQKSGELANAIISESERLAQAFYALLYLTAAAIVAAIYLAIALLVAWSVTLALIAFAAVMALSAARIYRKSFAVGRTIAPLNSELQTVIGEHLAGIKIIKVTAREAASESAVDGLVRKLATANTFVNFLPAAVRGMFEFLGFVFLATVFVFGNQWLDFAPGNIIVVMALFLRLFPRITTTQVYLHSLGGYLHAIQVIHDLTVKAESQAERQGGAAERLSVALPARLEICGLEVMLEENKVLDRVDLSFELPGMLGIVGGSGAGKSTLMHAILGLVVPSAGTVRLGPHALASTPLAAWRCSLGYVPQETMLFHASVRANLTLGKPEASDAEIESAARQAHAHAFIAALPRGYDTLIGDQGVRLSGGQRQRLGIARALLPNPVLLLMDEAMSALDAESEAEILAALDAMRKKIGIVLIAHRLAAVRNADRICVLEGGRVAEFGAWDELVRHGSRLSELVEAQNVT